MSGPLDLGTLGIVTSYSIMLGIQRHSFFLDQQFQQKYSRLIILYVKQFSGHILKIPLLYTITLFL